MPDYRLYTCPVCRRSFQREDDVVVCPLCGAPHHRSCWKTAGGCACRAAHGTLEQWQPPVFRVDDDAVVCGNCGTVNRTDDAVCSCCGRELTGKFPDVLDLCPDLETSDFFVPSGPYVNVPPDGVIAGRPVMEIASFVGPRMGYYLPRFRFIEQTQKGSWNWAATLFPAGWLLYRKMYGHFCAVLVLSLTLAIPEGLLLWSILSGWTGGAAMELSAEVAYLSQAFFSLTLLFRLTMGNLGTKWYFRHCVRTMARLERRRPELTDFRGFLSRRGGVHPVATGVYIVLCIGGAALAAGWQLFHPDSLFH